MYCQEDQENIGNISMPQNRNIDALQPTLPSCQTLTALTMLVASMAPLCLVTRVLISSLKPLKATQCKGVQPALVLLQNTGGQLGQLRRSPVHVGVLGEQHLTYIRVPGLSRQVKGGPVHQICHIYSCKISKSSRSHWFLLAINYVLNLQGTQFGSSSCQICVIVLLALFMVSHLDTCNTSSSGYQITLTLSSNTLSSGQR